MLQPVQSQSCFCASTMPVSCLQSTTCTPKCDSPVICLHVPILQGSAQDEVGSWKVRGNTVCPDQGAAAGRGHFDLWGRCNGPLLGKGRQIKKSQASTLEDSGGGGGPHRSGFWFQTHWNPGVPGMAGQAIAEGPSLVPGPCRFWL